MVGSTSGFNVAILRPWRLSEPGEGGGVVLAFNTTETSSGGGARRRHINLGGLNKPPLPTFRCCLNESSGARAGLQAHSLASE
ncbi:hypothetical protein chiPu_0015846 [Chiloscyllium punctatum]|uniref:Uncharacterized protein n=1 Tax=Chiloscyllium punctatum TaxID=137246 RepID=A0A401T3X8_CHIPU|nr:hypothetical protein [Chiloscyllium punctatum]